MKPPKKRPAVVISIDSIDRVRSLAERDRLVETHLYLVEQLAHCLARKLPGGLDAADLVGAGNLGLLRAATVYRKREGIAFAAFAQRVIKRFMVDTFRERNWKTATMEALPAAHYEQPSDSPTPEAICIGNDSAAKLGARVSDAIASLPPRWRTVVELHYSGEGKKLCEVAEMLEVTAGRVSQIRSAALERLRAKILA